MHPDLTEPGKGQIIILNGTSSSGKSSIAVELQAILDLPYHHFVIDRFRSMGAGKTMSDDEFAIYFQRTILGFHRAAAGFASVEHRRRRLCAGRALAFRRLQTGVCRL